MIFLDISEGSHLESVQTAQNMYFDINDAHAESYFSQIKLFMLIAMFYNVRADYTTTLDIYSEAIISKMFNEC